MTTIIILGICLIIAIVCIPLTAYFLTKEHVKGKTALHDRLMSKDYPEFMQGKDFQLELDRKEKDIHEKSKVEKPTLSKADLANEFAAREF